jgi:hypothetical protein
VDNGTTWQDSTLFRNLGEGTYRILVKKRTSGCTLAYPPLTLRRPYCQEICGDGIDNDFDGLVDCADTLDCGVSSFTVTAMHPVYAPTVVKGSITIHPSDSSTYRYSIDSGATRQAVPVFTNLEPGAYNVMVYSEECVEAYEDNPVFIRRPQEICDNGLDDDGDGLADCNDPECSTNPECTSATDRTICEGEEIELGMETNDCVSWEPADGLDDPHSNFIKVRPDKTTIYRMRITNDQGDLVETKTFTVNVTPAVKINPDPALICGEETVTLNATAGFAKYVWSTNETSQNIEVGDAGTYSVTATHANGCESTDEVFVAKNDPNEIRNFFEYEGFSCLPIRIIDDPGIKKDQQKSLNSCILDYANLSLEIEGEIVNNIGGYFQSICDNGGKVFITSNESFCTQVPNLSEQLSSSCPGIWVHLWDNPNEEGNDCLLFNTIQCADLPLSEKKDNCINVEGWDIKVNDENLPSHTYTVTHRSFAPWILFGDLFGIPGTKNSYRGDDRGFSLAPSITEPPSTETGATARIHQFAKITLNSNQVDNSARFASRTIGRETFIPQTNCSMFSDVGGSESFSSNSLEMHVYGSDPCIFPTLRGLPAPNIDWRVKLNFNVVSETPDKKWLVVKGIILGKAFPAYELFIEDVDGKKVFIHTYGAPYEYELGKELVNPVYDYHYPVLMKIKIDAMGKFTDLIEINEYISPNNFPYNPQITGTGIIPMTYGCVNVKFFSVPIFEKSSISINQWNQSNLNKHPAKDCTEQPGRSCQGSY